MNFDLFGYEFSASKKAVGVLIRDVDYINAACVNTILDVGSDFYINKVDELSLGCEDDFLLEATDRLNNDGVFIIPNYLEEKEADSICSLIEDLYSEYSSKLEGNENYEDKSAIVQRNEKLVKGYSKLARHKKSVIDVRVGADDGMVDIFNVDKLILDSAGSAVISKIKNSCFIKEVLKSISSEIKIRNINSYVNSGITTTRGFHADSYSKQIKIFIYLTDVLSFNDGPYTYVKGSHVETPYRRINMQLSKDLRAKTEAPIVPFENIYPILAPKGALVVSDQAGFHRGFPQSKNGRRRILTINCN